MSSGSGWKPPVENRSIAFATCDNISVNPWLIATPVALSAAVTAYAAVNPRSELFGPLVWQANSPQKLAITFDDGPNLKITPQLLAVLERYEARATFFVIGRFARECGALLREIADRGHSIGNHSDTHANLFWRTAAQIREEIQGCNKAISTITGATPQWFRPPWGMRNPWVISSATAAGLRTVTWTDLPGDWRAKPADWLIERMELIASHAHGGADAVGNSYRGNGRILCLHDGDHRFQNGDRQATVAAMEYWLPRWRDLGLEFVTIDDAVSVPA
jgi:peptidoglycan/xylan/chitin deacetylase (PgdA/CDA1 family)